jgi:predicted metal-dependent HD superfamily phosphohydrolase
MIRAEYHWVDGTAWISNRENNLREAVQLWDIASLLVSYRF